MSRYLGEEVVPIAETPYANFTPADWVMEFVSNYGQIDGGHHKAWVLDQVARILKGTPVIVSKASWALGVARSIEWRWSTATPPSKEYLDWVVAMKRGSAMPGEEDEYGYEEGVAP